MADEKKGHFSEIPWQMLDVGFRFYKLPRMLTEIFGYGASNSNLLLKLATLVDGESKAKKRTSLTSDSQLMRKIRSGNASTEDLETVFAKLVKNKIRFNEAISDDSGEIQISASGYLRPFVNGLLLENPQKPTDPWFKLVLEFYLEILNLEDSNIAWIRSIQPDSERKVTASHLFQKELGIDFEIVKTPEQDFFARAGVLRCFSASIELAMVSDIDSLRSFPSHFLNLLPSIDTKGKFVFSTKKLIDVMFREWKKQTGSKSTKKNDFYLFVTIQESNSREQLDKLDPAVLRTKKRINRWELAKSNIPLSQFWPMFSWAFTETYENGKKSDNPPLQIVMLLMCVNLFTENQKLGLSIEVSQEQIVKFYSDYLSISSQEKKNFERFLSKKSSHLGSVY